MANKKQTNPKQLPNKNEMSSRAGGERKNPSETQAQSPGTEQGGSTTERDGWQKLQTEHMNWSRAIMAKALQYNSALAAVYAAWQEEIAQASKRAWEEEIAAFTDITSGADLGSVQFVDAVQEWQKRVQASRSEAYCRMAAAAHRFAADSQRAWYDAAEKQREEGLQYVRAVRGPSNISGGGPSANFAVAGDEGMAGMPQPGAGWMQWMGAMPAWIPSWGYLTR